MNSSVVIIAPHNFVNRYLDIYDFRVMVAVVDNLLTVSHGTSELAVIRVMVAVVENLPDEGDHSVIETLQ